MKQFKNQFSVGGKPLLLKAFAEELKEIGYDEKIGDGAMALRLLEVNYNNVNGHIYNSYHRFKVENPDYTLPRDWEAAIAAAKEEKIAIPEYVEFVYIGGDSRCFTIGKVYKVNLDKYEIGGRMRVKADDNGDENGWESEYFIPSTKEKYEAQKKEEQLRITGRVPIVHRYVQEDDEDEILDVLAIGCQKFTRNTVEMLLEIMKYQDEEDLTWESSAHDGEVTITKSQLEKLVKLWKS